MLPCAVALSVSSNFLSLLTSSLLEFVGTLCSTPLLMLSTMLLRRFSSCITQRLPASYMHNVASHYTTASPPPLPSPAPHVLIYGGGAIGLLHASFMQLRLNHEHKSSSIVDSGSVRVVSSQRSMINQLCQHGLELELLRSFAQANESWMPDEIRQQIHKSDTVTDAEPTSSHLSHLIRIQATDSALTPLDHPPYSHILICIKGEQAFDHVCREIVQLPPSAIVCLLMNGMGHEQRMLERLDAILKENNSAGSALSDIQRREFIDQFKQRLILATTTSGARLQKEFIVSPNDASPPLLSLRLRHGGMGVTTIMQNEFESLATSSSSSSPSQSLMQLFQSIGLTSVIYPHSMASSMLHTKLLINCVINPLTALYGIRNGQLLDDEARFRLSVLNLTSETIKVFIAMQVDVAKPTQKQLMEAAQEVHEAVQSAMEFATTLYPSITEHSSTILRNGLFHVYSTCFLTQHNYSSMYTDLHPPASTSSLQPRTVVRSEIDVISGYILKQAKERNMLPEDIKYTQAIYEEIKAAERRLNTK